MVTLSLGAAKMSEAHSLLPPISRTKGDRQINNHSALCLVLSKVGAGKKCLRVSATEAGTPGVLVLAWRIQEGFPEEEAGLSHQELWIWSQTALAH